MVDDGSSDGSGRICDEYALKNDRIKVIHQENKGQSSARNVGIDSIEGEYVAFVDSDDWLDENTYSLVSTIIEKYQPDIVCFDYVMTNEKGDKVYHGLNSKELKHVSPRDIIEMIIRDEGVRSYAFNKVYRREFFSQLRFPEGQVFEDVDIVYRPFFQADKVCYLRQELYYYRLREVSTTHERDVGKIIRNLIYIYNAKIKRAELVEQNYDGMHELLTNDILVSALDVYDRIRGYKKEKVDDYNVGGKSIDFYMNEAYSYICDNYETACDFKNSILRIWYYSILINHKTIYDVTVLKIKKFLWILHRIYKFYIKKW